MDKAEMGSELKVSRYICKIFEVRLAAPENACEITPGNGKDKFDINDLENILIQKISKAPHPFDFLFDAYQRSQDETISRVLDSGSKDVTGEAQNQIINFSALLLQCPEMFGDTFTAHVYVESQFREKVVGGLGGGYLWKVASRIEENDPQDLKMIFDPIFAKLELALANRSLCDPAVGPSRVMCQLASCKPLGRLITRHPKFLPEMAKWQSQFQRKEGYTMERNSILGHFLSLTPIDQPTSVAHKNSKTTPDAYVRVGYKSFSSPTLTAQHVASATSTIRSDMQNMIESSHQFVKNLLKADLDSRLRVLKWFGAVCTSMESRAKLAHQLDAGRLSSHPTTEFMTINMTGEVSFGFALNCMWLLLKLTEPLKPEKIGDIDPFYALNSNPEAEAVLSGYLKEAKLGDSEGVAKALRHSQNNPRESKFITQIFWLASKGLRVLLAPSMREMQGLYSRMSQAGEEQKKFWADLFCWRVVVLDPSFCALIWHHLKLVMSFFLHHISATQTSQKENSGKQMPVELSGLPGCLVDDVFDLVTKMSDLQLIGDVLNMRAPFSSPNSGADWDIFISFAIAVMSAAHLFPNVHTRCSGSTAIARILEDQNLRGVVERSPVATEKLMPALLVAYIDSQKASYYDRLAFRLPVMESLNGLLQEVGHRDRFRTIIKDNPQLFAHFVHLLLNDLSWLMEQATTHLAEVRRRENNSARNNQTDNNSAAYNSAAYNSAVNTSAPNNPASNNPTNNSRRSTNLTDGNGSNNMRIPPPSSNSPPSSNYPPPPSNPTHEEEEDEVENNEVGGQSDSRLQERTRTYATMGLRSCVLLWRVARYFGKELLESRAILPQAITCLDCCLELLVGPRCLSLKVKNNSEYSFDPRDLLAKICGTYLFLYQAAKERQDDNHPNNVLVTQIAQEGRYFKPEIFQKAHRLLSREAILNAHDIQLFQQLARCLATQESLQDFNDLPSEYLDPIMQEVMMDPVRLPTSGTIMDRRNIERHLMSDEHDPYNRAPLKVSELEPLPELKAEIDAFIAERRSAQLSNQTS